MIFEGESPEKKPDWWKDSWRVLVKGEQIKTKEELEKVIKEERYLFLKTKQFEKAYLLDTRTIKTINNWYENLFSNKEVYYVKVVEEK